MGEISLATAQTIIEGALAHAKDQGFKPLSVVVLDARGAMKALSSQDGVSLKRAEIAIGKAQGAIALGMGSRALGARAEQQAYFVAAVTHAVGGMLVPVPGGVLVKSGDDILGAVGISGDISDNDEAAAVAGIEAANLTADPG